MRSKSQNSPAVIRQSAQCVAGLKVSNSVLGPEAAIGDDPLAMVEGETHGTDADAADYLIKGDED